MISDFGQQRSQTYLNEKLTDVLETFATQKYDGIISTAPNNDTLTLLKNLSNAGATIVVINDDYNIVKPEIENHNILYIGEISTESGYKTAQYIVTELYNSTDFSQIGLLCVGAPKLSGGKPERCDGINQYLTEQSKKVLPISEIDIRTSDLAFQSVKTAVSTNLQNTVLKVMVAVDTDSCVGAVNAKQVMILSKVFECKNFSFE